MGRALVQADMPGHVTGLGSLAHVHLVDAPVHDYRGAAGGRRWLHRPVHLALLNRGIVTAPRGMLALSTVLTEAEIDEATIGFAAALAEVPRDRG